MVLEIQLESLNAKLHNSLKKIFRGCTMNSQCVSEIRIGFGHWDSFPRDSKDIYFGTHLLVYGKRSETDTRKEEEEGK